MLNSSGSLALSGAISGSGSFIHIGSGTTTLSGNNTYTGDTTITNGAVQANSTNALGTGAVTLSGGATLWVNSLLTINSLNWASTNAYIGISGLGTNYLTVTNGVTLGSLVNNTFNLTGDTFTGVPQELLDFGSSGLTTNEFSVIGATNYTLSVSNQGTLHHCRFPPGHPHQQRPDRQ